MSTLLAPQRPSGIPDTQRLTSRPPHVSLADRVALHIGLRLVLWSTRTPRLALDREQHSRSYTTQADTIAREHRFARNVLVAPRP